MLDDRHMEMMLTVYRFQDGAVLEDDEEDIKE